MRPQSSSHTALIDMTALCLALAAPSVAVFQPAGSERTEPARFRAGDVPPPPLTTMTHAGGVTFFEVKITASGFVDDVIVLESAPPFTELLEEEIRLWRFHPALQDGKPVKSSILVAGLYRSGELTGGEPPSPRPPTTSNGPVPYPTEIVTPPFPPRALFGGTVMLEVDIDSEGSVAESHVIQGFDTFTQLSLEAVTAWRFRPARSGEEATTSRALVLFVFPQPTTLQRPRPSPRK